MISGSLAMRRDPLAFLTAAERRDGPVATFRIGPSRWVLLSDADAISEVLVARAGDFDKPDAIYGAGRPIFGHALTGLKGEVWRRRRTLVAPAFRRQPVVAERIVTAVDRWLDKVADGRPRRLDQDLRSLTVEVALHNLLVDHAANTDHLGSSVAAALGAMSQRARLPLPIPDRFPVAPNVRMRRAVREIDTFWQQAITQRREAGTAGTDLLGEFLVMCGEPDSGFTDADIRGELTAMAVGGVQQSIALSWVLYLLGNHPSVKERVAQEISTLLTGGRAPELTDIADLSLTGAVIDEALRLYPPFFLIGREAIRGTEISGYRISAQTTVVLSPWVTHRLERYYAQPDVFLPDRWADGLARRLPRGAYFPLGGGARLCLAQASVRKELVLVLAAIMRGHCVTLDPDHPVAPHPTASLELHDGLVGTIGRR